MMLIWSRRRDWVFVIGTMMPINVIIFIDTVI